MYVKILWIRETEGEGPKPAEAFGNRFRIMMKRSILPYDILI